MPLPITSPPKIIDQPHLSSSYQARTTTWGPFLIGTDIWQLCLYNFGAGADTNFGLYKNGVEIGLATKPYPNDIDISSIQVLVSGTKIAVLAQHVSFGSPIFIVELDTVAGTYGTPIVLGGVTASLGNHAFFYKRASDGAYVVISRNPVSNQNGIWYNIISGGSWGGYAVIDGAENPIQGAAVDGLDNIHAVFDHSGVLAYRFINSSFFASAAVTVAGTFDNTTTYTPVQVLSSSIAVAYTDNASMFVAIGTPLSNPTSFSPSTLQTAAAGQVIWYPALGRTNAAGLAAMWVLSNTVDSDGGGGGGTPVIDIVNLSTYNGTTWSPPALVYDEVANPPPPSTNPKTPDTNDLEGVGFLQLSNGNWVLSICIDTLVGMTDYEPTFLIGLGTSLSVPCPTQTTGTVGVPFSATVTASGGTPPYTYTITSGALPPGLGISSGGVISGVPTTPGSYVFTIGVTDSASNTATSPICTIVIVPSGGGGGGVPKPPTMKCPTGTWSVFEGTTPPATFQDFVTLGRGVKQ